MSAGELFTSGSDGLVPQGDAARQAIDSLRGYAYQVTAAALAWLDVDEHGRLFLEVAEDYAVVARNTIEAVQVKDTEASGSVTLNTGSVRDAVSNFVSLKASNPNVDVELRYFTSSEIGTERAREDRLDGMAGLDYWRKAATGADVGPVRSILESDKFSADVQEFVKARDDRSLRDDLLRKIHWDCGKPDIGGLRKEFEQRLIVIGRDLFRLAAPEAIRLADALVYHVLERSIVSSPGARVLTRADLYSSIDQATRISVPRAAADTLAFISSSLTAVAVSSLGAGLPVAAAEPGWLIEGRSLPSANRMVTRKAIEKGVADRVQQYGAGVIIGASGLGKSSIARSVARSLTDEFLMVDFRNADAEETRARLSAMVSRVGGLRPQTIIFEDLNCFSDPLVSPSLARVFEALRRRDRSIIVTCYLSPTAKSFSDVGLDNGCSIDCPYFTEVEATELVALHGGDPGLWGRLAFVAGAFGHPQLVHAFIAGIGARGWPRSEFPDIVDRGLSSRDVEAEREAARRALVSVIPEGARNLLYRLSLALGQFDRAMALTIAGAPPPIAQAGECLDILIGPWLETVGRDRYRVSPLAAQSGKDIFSPAEQVSIHSTIATQFLVRGTINGNDVDVIMLHAMLGKNEYVLVSLANAILKSDERTAERLADNVATFKFLRMDKPIYQENLTVSLILRLAQLKVVSTTREADKIAECAAALLSEADKQPIEELRANARAMSLAFVLGTKGIANYLDNWLDLLGEFQDLTEADELLQSLRSNFEKDEPLSSGLFGILFAIGSAETSTVMVLERIVDQLDKIEPERRSFYLSALSEMSPDYGIFINGPWSLEHQRNSVNAAEAAERYRRMAIKTANWGVRPITVQCWVARAIMLDEYANDSGRALQVLDEAVEALGDDVILSRARARIYWRRNDHERALSILREIADRVGRNNHIERAFALREAAICAAKTGEWAEAETWFRDSQSAAAESEIPDMVAMAIGLGADAAVAAVQLGEIERALMALDEALDALAKLDPSSSIRAIYCHHVIRHTVLWAQSHIERAKIRIDGSPIGIEPGCCSNPEPPEVIADRPLGSLDMTRYMLAGIEIIAGKNLGIADALQDRLADGPIPVMEIDLRERRVRRGIVDLDAGGFVQLLWSYIEAIAYLSCQSQQLREGFNPLNPARGDIPSLSRNSLSDPAMANIPTDAILAFAIAAACRRSTPELLDLAAKVKAEFGDDLPAGRLLDWANATIRTPAASSFEEALMDSVIWFRGTEHKEPRTYLLAAVRFFQQAVRSHFKSYLIAVVAQWQREAWTRIVVSETFRLSRPLQTVPEIKAALSISEDDERFLCTLFLASANAVGTTLPPDLQTEFENLARGAGT